jgi:8-oxo-dGTP pyrophosphatase MutT (NUDIX family)
MPALPASSVVLIRDGEPGLEVYVHVRRTTMAFAGGMLAFPGGRVDSADAATAVDDAWWWAQRLGTDDVDSARAYVSAAVRETEEETGVRLRTRDLHPWAHWITPRFEPRRYDTWFFLAAQPSEQSAHDVSGEASAVAWATPSGLIGESALPGPTMLPPTRSILEELALFTTVQDCLAAGRDRVVDTVLPGWVDDGEVVRALLPGDDEYPGDDPGEPS